MKTLNNIFTRVATAIKAVDGNGNIITFNFNKGNNNAWDRKLFEDFNIKVK